VNKYPVKVSFWGMYDMHLFHKYEPRSVSNLIEQWRVHNSTPSPAIVGGREVDDLGPTTLFLPTVVYSDGSERKLGGLPFECSSLNQRSSEKAIQKFCDAVRADDEIMSFLPDEICAEDVEIMALDKAQGL